MFWIKIFVSILLTVSICYASKKNVGYKSIVVENGKPILRLREDVMNDDGLEEYTKEYEVEEWNPQIEASKLESSAETADERDVDPMVEDDVREDETEMSHPESPQAPQNNQAPEEYWKKKVEEEITKMQQELGYNDAQPVIRKLVEDAEHYFRVRMKVEGKTKLSVDAMKENETYPDAVVVRTVAKKPKLETIDEWTMSEELKPQRKPIARAVEPSEEASTKRHHRHRSSQNEKNADVSPKADTRKKKHHSKNADKSSDATSNKRKHRSSSKNTDVSSETDTSNKKQHSSSRFRSDQDADSTVEVNTEKNDHEIARSNEKDWMPHMKTFVRYLVDRFGKGEKLDARLKPVIRSVEKDNKITINDIDGEVLIEYSPNKKDR